jgi:hypothetical protein
MNSKKVKTFHQMNGDEVRFALAKTKPVVQKFQSEECTYTLLDADWNRNGISGRSFWSLRVFSVGKSKYKTKKGKKVVDETFTSYDTLTIIYAEPEQFYDDNDKLKKTEAFCAVTNDADLSKNYRGDNIEPVAKKLVAKVRRLTLRV